MIIIQMWTNVKWTTVDVIIHVRMNKDHINVNAGEVINLLMTSIRVKVRNNPSQVHRFSPKRQLVAWPTLILRELELAMLVVESSWNNLILPCFPDSSWWHTIPGVGSNNLTSKSTFKWAGCKSHCPYSSIRMMLAVLCRTARIIIKSSHVPHIKMKLSMFWFLCW